LDKLNRDLLHGADVNLADSYGVTPLRHAQNRGYREMAEALSAAGGKQQ